MVRFSDSPLGEAATLRQTSAVLASNYFDKTGVLAPMVLTELVFKFVAVTEVSPFLHLDPIDTPSVPD